MRKLMLLAGVAALSVSLPVVAKENQGRGQGGGQAERSQGGGQGKAQRGRGGDGNANAQRSGGGNADVERGNGRQRVASRGRDSDDRGTAQSRSRGNADRGNGNADRSNEARIERRANRDDRQVVREARQHREVRQDVREERRAQSRDWTDWSQRRLITADRYREDLPSWRNSRGRGVAVGANGCPPGLAKQNAYCMPPGQLRKAQFYGQRLAIANSAYNVPDRYRYRFVDNDDWYYRYDDEGFVYRFDRNNGLVNSIVPLFGNNLMMGEPLPLGYEVYNVPLSYRSYYPDGGDNMYRYNDGAIYQVDPQTNLIGGIVALLTGGVGGLGGLGIGDTLPRGYDAYNMPLDYRDQYADTDDAWYRYADGSVYEVDPQTRLIEQVISLLV